MIDFDTVEIKAKPVNKNELIMLALQAQSRYNAWEKGGFWRKGAQKSSLVFGRTCDVAIASVDVFRILDVYEHFADLTNFWGVDFDGEIRGLFIVSTNGYAVLATDQRSEGELSSFFEFGHELIKILDLLEDYTVDDAKITGPISALDTEGFKAHAYSLITRDEKESLRKRDLQLLNWSFPKLLETVNSPSKAKRDFLAYGRLVSDRLNDLPVLAPSGIRYNNDTGRIMGAGDFSVCLTAEKVTNCT